MIEKTSRITVRFLPEDAAKIAEQAKFASLTVAEYIRRRALGVTIHAQPSVTDEEAVRILRRAIGLIKQIYKREIVDSKQTYAALNEATKAIHKITGGRDDLEAD